MLCLNMEPSCTIAMLADDRTRPGIVVYVVFFIYIYHNYSKVRRFFYLIFSLKSRDASYFSVHRN